MGGTLRDDRLIEPSELVSKGPQRSEGSSLFSPPPRPHVPLFVVVEHRVGVRICDILVAYHLIHALSHRLVLVLAVQSTSTVRAVFFLGALPTSPCKTPKSLALVHPFSSRIALSAAVPSSPVAHILRRRCPPASFLLATNFPFVRNDDLPVLRSSPSSCLSPSYRLSLASHIIVLSATSSLLFFLDTPNSRSP